jgi:hypothetical protein
MINVAMPPVDSRRVAVILGSMACVLAFAWAYLAFLWPEYSYFNFTYWPHGWFIGAVVFTLSVLPSLWIPTELTRPSQLLYWTLYVTVYIPSIFTVPYANARITEDILILLCLFCASFIGLGQIYRAPLFRPPPVVLSRRLFWIIILLLASITLAMILRVYGSHLQFIGFLGGFEGITKQRLAARELEAGQTLLGYAYAFLASVIAPFLMAYGLFRKKTLIFFFGAGCELILYSAAGTKATILSIPMAMLLYWLLQNRTWLGGALSWGSAATIALFTILGTTKTLIGKILGALVLLRIFGTPGQATMLYHEYFSTHPVTYFSHVRGISSLISYPYSESIPFVIGLHFWNSPDLSANAHFWAQDGLAGLGILGIPIITLLAAFLFWLLDSVSDGLNPAFVAVALAYQALNLSNGSLFTLLLTSGLAAQFILLYLLPREGLAPSDNGYAMQRSPIQSHDLSFKLNS